MGEQNVLVARRNAGQNFLHLVSIRAGKSIVGTILEEKGRVAKALGSDYNPVLIWLGPFS
jgi:hypothetical protein